MNDIWGNANNNQSSIPNFFNTKNFDYRLPRYEIIKVHGEEGARSLRMAPNSNVILADDTGAMIWVAQTDGAGYLTVTPYDIIPHQIKQSINIDDLAQRVSQLEEIINARQSNSQSNKSTKRQTKQQQPITEQSLDAAN